MWCSSQGADGIRLGQRDGKRGLSPIPTHPQPLRQPAGFDTCLFPSEKLSPREWLKCLHSGRIQLDHEDQVRFTDTGVVATRDKLVAWVNRGKGSPWSWR